MGDVGGLYDGLLLAVHHFVVPIAAFSLNSELIVQLFSLVTHQERTNSSDKKEQALEFINRSENRVSIKRQLCLATCFRRKGRFRKMLDRADSSITR